MKFDVAKVAAKSGVGWVGIDAVEYGEFVRHHAECEKLGTALAEAVKALPARWSDECGECVWCRLDEAVAAYDAHPQQETP